MIQACSLHPVGQQITLNVWILFTFYWSLYGYTNWQYFIQNLRICPLLCLASIQLANSKNFLLWESSQMLTFFHPYLTLDVLWMPYSFIHRLRIFQPQTLDFCSSIRTKKCNLIQLSAKQFIVCSFSVVLFTRLGLYYWLNGFALTQWWHHEESDVGQYDWNAIHFVRDANLSTRCISVRSPQRVEKFRTLWCTYLSYFHANAYFIHL